MYIKLKQKSKQSNEILLNTFKKNPYRYLQERANLTLSQQRFLDWALLTRHPEVLHSFSQVQDVSPAIRYLLLKQNPMLIKNFRKQTIFDGWVALLKDVNVISYMDFLTVEQIKYAFKKGKTINDLSSPLPKSLEFEAIRLNENNLQFIQTQTDRLRLEAIKGDPYQCQFSSGVNFEMALESMTKVGNLLADFSFLSLFEGKEQRELELIATGDAIHYYPLGVSTSIEALHQTQQQLKEEVKQLFDYQHNHQIGVLEPPKTKSCIKNQITDDWVTIEAGLECYPMTLSLLPNYLKSYRHCRLATARDTKTKLFSPYHVYEFVFNTSEGNEN